MNNSILRSTLLIFIMTCLILGSACTSKSDTPAGTTAKEERLTLDINATCESILAQEFFQDELAVVDASYSEMLMNITPSEYKSGVIYMGSGATAERLAIFDAGDDANADALLNKCKTHVQEQITSYADYMPKEVDKLEHAIILCKQQYVILCVAGNYEEAEVFIRDLLK
ncbi:MAG: DUF4358 domain-containing protein [Lachnospiraceae bacterium]